MNLVQRATGILTQPRPEWSRIDPEPTSTATLFTGYALALAALPFAVQLVVALGLAGVAGLTSAAIAGLITLAIGLAIVFAVGLAANALAPSFGGVRNKPNAMKLAVYAATPLWIAGVAGALLAALPVLGAVLGFVLQVAAFAYTAYLLYLGAPILMRVPAPQALTYALTIAAIWLVIYLIVAAIMGVALVMMFGAAALASAASGIL